eukprot:10345510-Prorocentrum_lima.AAC.1
MSGRILLCRSRSLHTGSIGQVQLIHELQGKKHPNGEPESFSKDKKGRPEEGPEQQDQHGFC